LIKLRKNKNLKNLNWASDVFFGKKTKKNLGLKNQFYSPDCFSVQSTSR